MREMTDVRMAALLILAATVVSTVVLLRALRQIYSRGEWRNGASAAFLLAALGTSFVDIIVTFTGGWHQTKDSRNNILISPPGWAHQLQLAFYIVMGLGCLAIFMLRIVRPGAEIHLPALLLLLVALLTDASSVLHGDDPWHPYYIIPLLILAAATVAPRGLGIHIGLGTFCMIAAIASGVASVLSRGFSLFACVPSKCGLLDVTFRGILDNENALAMYLALAMPFVFVAFGHRSGGILSAYFLFLILFTGSRSGAIAASITLLLLLFIRPSIRRPQRSTVKASVLYGVLAAVAAVGLVLPLVVKDPRGLTGRGYLWMLARGELQDAPALLIGKGALGWQNVRQAGLIDFSATYSVHNQWLQVTYGAGLVGLALLVAGLVLLIKQAGPQYRLVVGCVLTPVMCLAITERPWSIDYLDWLIWALPGALLCLPRTGVGGATDLDLSLAPHGRRRPLLGTKLKVVVDP